MNEGLTAEKILTIPQELRQAVENCSLVSQGAEERIGEETQGLHDNSNQYICSLLPKVRAEDTLISIAQQLEQNGSSAGEIMNVLEVLNG